MENIEIVEIDKDFDHSEMINSILGESKKLIRIITDIHRYYVPKIQFVELDNKKVPVIKSLKGNDLIDYSNSVHYRIKSFIVQIEILEETLEELLKEVNKDKQSKLDFKSFNHQHYMNRLNVTLDNLIIYSLTLLEYVMTFISHICLTKVINNWKKFFNKVRNEDNVAFLRPKVKHYNKSITKLQNYRNSLVHKQINTKDTTIFYDFIKWEHSFKFSFSKELYKSAQSFIFVEELDFTNNILLHYSIVREFIKVSSDLALTLRINMFDENGKSVFY